MPNPFDPGTLARLDLEGAREDRARVEKLVTALKEIAAFQPDLSKHDAEISALWTETGECLACTEIRVRKWPPSGMCNSHFGKLHRLQSDRGGAEAGGKYEMKTIAMRALMMWEGVS
jgi:hypothetical protein